MDPREQTEPGESALLAYRENQVRTASPDRLVLLLFEAALKAAKAARGHLTEENRGDAAREARLVQDIMVGLVDTLNSEHPEAGTMRDLYLYCWRETVAAQTQTAPNKLDSVIRVLDNLAVGLRRFIEQGQAASVVGTGSVNLAG